MSIKAFSSTLFLACFLAGALPVSCKPSQPRDDRIRQRQAATVTYVNMTAAKSALAEAGISSVDTVVATLTQIATPSAPDPKSFATPGPMPTMRIGGPDAHQYSGPAYLSHGRSHQPLRPGLPQIDTNGASQWGTLQAPKLPPFLTTGGTPLQNGTPWGDRTARGTNYYDENNLPNTGVTRRYDFTLAPGTIAPDGVEKAAFLINGQFPAPLIEANWGDTISVTVHNQLAEGTSLHWHGMLQKQTPYYDGVPSVSQCPIAPGSSFTYNFRADLYGTSWYHSHYSAQYSAGLLGPMIIHGPSIANYDVDLGPVLLTDWYHAPGYQSLIVQTNAKADLDLPPPFSNNNLINGKMNYPCTANNTTLAGQKCTPNAGVSKFNFQSGKIHRLRLINAGAEAVQKFSIDGHTFTVIANDFVPITPYETDVITLGIGQRSDVLVHATLPENSTVWMRSNISIPCSASDGISPFAVAAVYYDLADPDSLPTSTSSVDPDKINYCGNDDLSLTQPTLPLTPDSQPEMTQDFNIVYAVNETGYTVWEMNGVSFRGDFNDPTLLEAKLGVTTFPEERNVYNLGTASSVRFVIYNYFQFGPHPMHLHGHNYYVLAEGYGTYNGEVTNPSNPQRRDTQIVRPAKSATEPAYIVLQIETDNSGVWPLHCHIAWHVSAGLYVNILERPADITERELPMVMAQTCRDWWSWTGRNVVDQIDSGL